MKKSALLLFALALFVSCLTSFPPDKDPDHLGIAWNHTYEQTQKKALEQNKPMLIVVAAGHLTKEC